MSFEELVARRKRERAAERQRSTSAAPEPLKWPKPEPLPSGTIPVDVFDHEFLPVALREWVRDNSNRLQCPPDYVAIAAVAALGTLIGRRLGIRPQEKKRLARNSEPVGHDYRAAGFNEVAGNGTGIEAAASPGD